MDWLQVLVIVFGNAAWVLPVFFWVRSESRADIRHMDNKLDAIREMTHAIHLEVKDFHSRLLDIERSRKN
jgi:hypothetical protein